MTCALPPGQGEGKRQAPTQGREPPEAKPKGKPLDAPAGPTEEAQGLGPVTRALFIGEAQEAPTIALKAIDKGATVTP